MRGGGFSRKHKECCYFGTYEHVKPVFANTKEIHIDACIADIVQALNDGGVITDASCCGHGIISGDIMLADGRILKVLYKGDIENPLYEVERLRIANLEMVAALKKMKQLVDKEHQKDISLLLSRVKGLTKEIKEK